MPLGLNWTAALVAAAEASFMLGEARVGRVVFELLTPFRDQVAFNGTWAVAPLAFGAGVAAAAGGVDASIVDDCFEQSIAVCDRLRAPALRARSAMTWSRVLSERGVFPEKVLSLVNEARRSSSNASL
jgi:hypothetical protein